MEKKYILEIQLGTHGTEFNVTVKMEKPFKWWIDLELLKDIYSTDLHYQTLKNTCIEHLHVQVSTIIIYFIFLEKQERHV